jgi:hypothetical protein
MAKRGRFMPVVSELKSAIVLKAKTRDDMKVEEVSGNLVKTIVLDNINEVELPKDE